MGKADKTEVDDFLRQRALDREFVSLTSSLKNTAGAWHGGYKGSSLSRAMLLDGHDAAFEAKGIKLTLLRSKNHLYWSEFRLCMTDVGTPLPPQELKPPFKIYGDGSKVRKDCHGNYKRMEPGVVAQSTSDGVHVGPQLQVEVLRMLMNKSGAMALQKQFEHDLGSGPQPDSWFEAKKNSVWAELVTRAYRERFAQVGLGLYYNRVISWCCCGEHCRSRCKHFHRWFEYVDRDALPYYKPEQGNEYDLSSLKNFIRCSPQDSQPRQMIQQSGLSFKDLKANMHFDNCTSVESASPRNKPDATANCKCPRNWKVYCDGREIAQRKFNDHDLTDCDDAYCSEEPCPGGLP
jgi:hypothetical protein